MWDRAPKILTKHLHPDSVYQDIVKYYGAMVGINTDVHGFWVLYP